MTEKVIVVSKIHKVLLVSVVKINAYILYFKRIFIQATQLLKIFFKTDKSAEVINLILIYQIVSLFLNNESKLSIYDFFIINEVLIVIYV